MDFVSLFAQLGWLGTWLACLQAGRRKRCFVGASCVMQPLSLALHQLDLH